jgi:hypothetical protein
MARKTAKRKSFKRKFRGGGCPEDFKTQFEKSLQSVDEDTVDTLGNTFDELNDVSCIEEIIKIIDDKISTNDAFKESAKKQKLDDTYLVMRNILLNTLKVYADERKKEIIKEQQHEKGLAEMDMGSLYDSEVDVPTNGKNPLSGRNGGKSRRKRRNSKKKNRSRR